jgi:hypothetical protein
MAHPAAIIPWAATGARPVALPRWGRPLRTSGARAVRTRSGIALFDELGHYIGAVGAEDHTPTFGPGADTVLLKRDGDF